MSSSEAVSDNLEVITGIGPEARKWLADTFDVRTFAALADLSEEQIIARMKAEKNTCWLQWAKDWPTAAAEKAAEMASEAEARQPALAADKQNNDPPLAARGTESSSSRPSNPRGGKDDWDTLALYFIEFQSRQAPGKPIELQTKVVFEGPGPQAQEILPGTEQSRICKWIFDHVGGILRAKPATEAPPGSEPMPQETGLSTISVSQLRLFQPAGVDTPLFSYSSERPQLSTVTADQPFDLETILEGRCPRAASNGRTTFNVRFLARNRDSNSYTNLGSVELETIEDQLSYSALLPGISLPRGKYRLQVLVLAHPKPIVLGSIEIPLLSVW